MRPACSMLGGADPDRILAAVVGTDMRGDRIRGAPRGVFGERNCCAASPGMAGDNIRDSAATAATRRQSSSPEEEVIRLVTRLLPFASADSKGQLMRYSPAEDAFELESLYVPLMIANSINWRFFSSSSPSACCEGGDKLRVSGCRSVDQRPGLVSVASETYWH